MTKLILATGPMTGNEKNPPLTLWNPSFAEFIRKVSEPVIGEKNGEYFIRCSGTIRSNAATSETASVLILDGDKTVHPDYPKGKDGAPNPELLHEFLKDRNINHCIYASFSNNVGYNKFRAVLPCEYTREQLPILLDYIFEELHAADIPLYCVGENAAWSQPWYFPRTPTTATSQLAMTAFNQFRAGINLPVTEIVAKHTAAHPKLTRAIKYAPRNKKGFDVITAFNICHADLFAYLASHGYDYALGSERMIPPASVSKTPSVWLCDSCADGITRVYAHSSNDKLYDDSLGENKAHDAFDCFRILECDGDHNAALIKAGDLITVRGVPLNKIQQHIYFNSRVSK